MINYHEYYYEVLQYTAKFYFFPNQQSKTKRRKDASISHIQDAVKSN